MDKIIWWCRLKIIIVHLDCPGLVYFHPFSRENEVVRLEFEGCWGRDVVDTGGYLVPDPYGVHKEAVFECFRVQGLDG